MWLTLTCTLPAFLVPFVSVPAPDGFGLLMSGGVTLHPALPLAEAVHAA